MRDSETCQAPHWYGGVGAVRFPTELQLRRRWALQSRAHDLGAPASGLIHQRNSEPRISKRGQDALRDDFGFLWIEFVSLMVAEALEQSSRYDCVGLMLVKHA